MRPSACRSPSSAWITSSKAIPAPPKAPRATSSISRGSRDRAETGSSRLIKKQSDGGLRGAALLLWYGRTGCVPPTHEMWARRTDCRVPPPRSPPSAQALDASDLRGSNVSQGRGEPALKLPRLSDEGASVRRGEKQCF